MESRQKKIILAVSGGVDSAVAAHLLKQKKYEVLGVYFRLFAGQNRQEVAARKICSRLGVKFYPLNLARKFQKEIIRYFINSYRDGSTPNPCVKCNQAVKFSELDRLRRDLGADYMATGHYAGIKILAENKFGLYQAGDKTKDQSYFLYTLNQDRLKRLLFPLGEYQKKDVKKIAARIGLPCISRESQDICFLCQDGKNIEHNRYLKKHLSPNPGPIMTLDKKILGQHQGLYLYTIGQRKGVEIGGTGPYYAARKDNKRNILYVVKSASDPALFSDRFWVYKVNWIAGQDPDLPFKCGCSIRYGHKPVKCAVRKDGKNKYKYTVIFDSPQRAITPGQSAVFYSGKRVLGGGIISKT